MLDDGRDLKRGLKESCATETGTDPENGPGGVSPHPDPGSFVRPNLRDTAFGRLLIAMTKESK